MSASCTAILEARERARRASERLRLPFKDRSWRGSVGSWSGAGVGGAIDFQDHRPYVPGDDPRYINWQAYARSGVYAMKLYREEVSPAVDVVFDVSRSMSHEDAKRMRSLEVFYFVVESALECGGALRLWVPNGDRRGPSLSK